jgi:hypothetical protein
MILIKAWFLLIFLITTESTYVEEFSMYGPNDFYEIAMQEFTKLKRENKDANMNPDGEFFKSAKEYAIERRFAKSEEQLSLGVSYNIHRMIIFFPFGQ